MRTSSSPRHAPLPKIQPNQKKACLGCRSIKVRCDRVEPEKVDSSISCTRCARLKIPCIVQEHHRGRRSAPKLMTGKLATTPPSQDQGGPMQLDPYDEQNEATSGQQVSPSTTLSGTPGSMDTYSSPSTSTPHSTSHDRLPESSVRDADETTHKDYLHAPVAGTISLSEFTPSQPGIDQDPISKNILIDADARFLHSFYMKEMNPIFALLDPILCTFEYLREKSTILFTAILTVAAKYERRDVYPYLLILSQELLAKAFICGTSSVETIQAIRNLACYRDYTDSSSYLKIGYAIRMAYDLSLDKPHSRPLPDDEIRAREILSGERCWYDLVSNDELVSRQRSRPLIISSEAASNPRRWLEENVKYRLDTDPFIAAQTSVCGMEYEAFSKLFSVNPPTFTTFAQRQGAAQAVSRRASLWAETWSKRTGGDYPFPIHQTSLALLHHFQSMLDFHTAEIYYRHVSSRPEDVNDVGKEFPALVAVFGATIAFFQVFVDDFGNGQLRFSPDYLLAGSAHVALWLFKNRSKMHSTMKNAVLSVLRQTTTLFHSSAKAPDESAAYQARFLDGLIKTIEEDNTIGSPAASPTLLNAELPSMNDPNSHFMQDMHYQHIAQAPSDFSTPMTPMYSVHGSSMPGYPTDYLSAQYNDPTQYENFSTLFGIGPDTSFWANVFPPLSH